MKQTFTSFLSLFVLFLLAGTVKAQTVDMKVEQGPNVDVMVTVGSANLDLSTFEDDLEQAMHLKGIPLGKLRVEAFQRSSISSDQADASDIFNSWNKMNFNGTEPPVHGSYTGDYFSFDSGTNRVIADFVGRYTSYGWGFAMYDPTGDIADGSISATWGLSEAPYAHGEVGFIFRKVDNQNFYAYIIDNHSACGNISGYGTDGDPAEAIIKVENGSITVLALNTNSGNSGSATYGWNGTRADMFDAYFNGQTIDFKIDLNGNNIKVSRRGGGGTAGTDWVEAFNFDDTTHAQGSYGFYVHEQSGAYFKDINIEKLELRAFKDVLREPQWRNSALRFNVNLDDLEVADFDNDADLAEILMRTINEDIHYIGWGTNTNEAQFERFITQNNNQGTFINRDSGSWSTWIDEMAQYIYEKYQFGTITDGEVFFTDRSVEIDVTPTELKTNTANASYPNGRWRITHDETYFDNSEGRVSWSGIYLDDLPETYDKVGQYTFTFEDFPTAPTILYFHRRPVASFTYSADTGFINNTSYDLDGGANNGIAQSEWKWKSVDAASTNDWNTGAFDKNAVSDGEYLVMLRVQDHQGTWSSPASIYVEKTAGSGGSSDLPIAQFTIQPDVLNTYSGNMTITIVDNSIDPYGRTLSTQEWIVTQRTYDGDGDPIDSEIYNASTPMTDFSAYNNLSADYIISMRTQTDTGVWSEPFYRTLTIVDDNTVPTITANPASGSLDTDTDILLVFQDENGGSGFDVQRFAKVQSATPPATDNAAWTSWSNSQSKTTSFNSGGSGWYIHAEVKDNAGNEGTASFGPYDITLVVSADDDLAILDEDSPSDPIDILYNDVYDTGVTPTVTITTQGTKGTAVVNGSNQVVYTPNANENGTDTVTYELDDQGQKATAKITLSILPKDDLPVANADSFNLDENATLNEDVSTNDVEVDGDDLVYHLISGPSHAASFTFNADGTFSYEHDGDESGTDSFTYNFEDAVSFSSTVTVTFNINNVNDLPEGGNITLDVIQDIAYTFAVSDFTFTDDDPSDAFNGIQIISLPANGTLEYNGNPVSLNDMINDITLLTYTTENGGYGANYASFSFKVKDGDDAVSTTTYSASITAAQDTDGDGIPDDTDDDDDGDGTLDINDDFPKDPTEDTDTDGDGTGDNADDDDDGDGTLDINDDFPKDPTEDTDTDGDGTGDNADDDDDGDGTLDINDDFPKDPTEDTDTDGDGTGDNADDDADNDGTPDDEDAFPLDPNEDADADGDGVGDNADDDDDNDGITDIDNDGDGLGDNVDNDDDNDGIPDSEDDFPNDASETTDTDGDGIGNNADTDDDGDGYSDELELEQGTDPTDASSIPLDTDGDGIPDSLDDDDDNDGVVDGDDAFPTSDEPTLVPAQAFTPNGDGNNDAWVIPGIDNYPNNRVSVYNRWGHEVFATQSYRNNWEGFYKSRNEKLPAGSYLYIIDLGDGSAPLQGWIFINY